MEEDTELEEGEAKEPCDPDTDFSYLDKKLQLLLGDQQKEFQGCTISTEKLGSKFGGYGTFLPTQARAPSMFANPLPPPHALEPASVLAEGNLEPIKRMAGAADKTMHPQPHGEPPPTQQSVKKKNGVTNDPVSSKKVMIRIKVGKGGEKESQPKTIQNGLSLEHSSSASLGNDDKHNLSDGELSPEPSPRSMIKIMLSYHAPRDLLSPLPPSFLEALDCKEKLPITLKVNKRSKAPLIAHPPGGKVDPHGGNEREIKADEREKPTAIEVKKFNEVVTDGGKRARRDSDGEKKIQKEPVLKGPVKVVKDDATNGEASIEKVVERSSMEDIESGKELMPKSGRNKQTDLKLEIVGIVKEEGSDVKVSRKLMATQDKDNKDTSRAKEIINQQGRKDREAAKFVATEKESNDKVASLTDGRKQGKDESKEIPTSKAKEVLKEVKKESQRKDSLGDFTAKEGHKETIKTTVKVERATKNEPSNVASRKDVMKDQKRSKPLRDTKVGEKERDREWGPMPEAMPQVEDEKVLGRVDIAAPAAITSDPVVMPTQLVLDNWVQCDKCETWRLLLPGIDTPDSSAKWNCKMMVWMPGMNNCKFTEEETTAAVYSYLGLQNPKLVPAIGAPAELPPPAPVMETVLKKSAVTADTKKVSRVTTGKKGLVGPIAAGVVKTAGSKGADGTLKRKSLNDVGVDVSADEIAYARILADKNKLKEKEKNKRQRTSEGEDLAVRKKVPSEEKPIQGSTAKHSGGMDVDMLQGEKETVHTEQNRVARERNEAGAQAVSSIPAKRKKQMEIADEGNEVQNLKKSKGHRVHSNDASIEEEVKMGERVNSQRVKPGSNVKMAKDSHYSRQVDIDAENIASVLKEIRSSPELYESGESEKGRDHNDNGRPTDVRKSKLELTKVLDKRKKLEDDEREFEHRAGKRPNQDVHGHPRLESKGRVTRTLLPSEQEPEIIEVAASPAPAAPLHVSGSKNEVFKKESLNHSTPSKICSSLESSRTRSKARGSPIESTVSSSPVRFNKGERERSSNQRGGPETLSVPNEAVLQQRSCSASSKHEEDVSHRSSWDEGEFCHAGALHGADASPKHDHSRGARDEEWNWDEHRVRNSGFMYDGHQDRSADCPEHNQDQDERDGRYERRGNQNSHFDGDHKKGGRDPWPSEQADAREDHSQEHNTRDDWGRPSSRESRLDKTGGSSCCDERQLERGEEVPTKDDSLPAVPEHKARDEHLVNRGTSWEAERAAPVSRKESDSTPVRPLDTAVHSKRPSATANARVKEDIGKAPKQEESHPGPLKAIANTGRDGEGTTGAPVKKEPSPAFTAAQNEGRQLKHSADRMKAKNKPGQEVESTNLYLQAALKFLQAASIVENENNDTHRAGKTQSMVVYDDTAKLCKYCAGQYERSRDMAAAALAYTCAAVALGRRMLCKNAAFARDCNELLAAAQPASGPHITSNGPLLPPPVSRSADKPGPSLAMMPGTGIGESPSSSSASDVDNLNNHTLAPSDKGTMTQMGRAGTASPQKIPGVAAPTSHSIPPCLRTNLIRFLKDANDMSNLLEAWQKAASVTAKADATCDPKGMLAVKKVGELGGFADIETVVHSVRVAMDAIGH